MSRASTFTPEIGEQILAGLAECKSLRAVCRELDLPIVTVLQWAEMHVAFGEQYTRVRAKAYEVMAEEIVEISDDISNDTIVTDNGDQPRTEWISRSKLRVDSRKWILSKMLPKVYGDKLDLNHSGTIDLASKIAQARKRDES